MLLNGRRSTLRGASMHEEDPTRGAALGPDEISANFELLRDLGATMTRSHYPLHPLALELADRLRDRRLGRGPGLPDARPAVPPRLRAPPAPRHGARDGQPRPQPPVGDRLEPRQREHVRSRASGSRRYLARRRHRAAARPDAGSSGLAFPGYPTIGKQDVYTTLDALGVNDYFGWYPGPGGSIADRAALAPYLDRLHDDYPRQALFVTEFGAEANRAGRPPRRARSTSRRFPRLPPRACFAQKPYLNGALVWILRDFRVKPGYDGGNPQPRAPLQPEGPGGRDRHASPPSRP